MSTGGRPSAEAPTPEVRPGGGLTGRMLLASGLLMLILGAAFTVLLITIGDLRDAARVARASEEVLTTANELERLVVDLETGVRGFIITEEEQFLEPFNAARRRLPERAATLARLTAGSGEQEHRARMIAQSVNSYVADYASPLVDAARRGDLAARGVAVTAEGKRRVDALRADFDAFIAAEGRLADARQQRADAAARRAVLAVVVGLAVALLLVLIFTAYLARAIVQPVVRAAQMAVRVAGGDLGTRMPATGVAEMGQLEQAFNQMAGSLQRNRDELAELAAEQAALRRVATLVARGASPPEVFSAVAEEMAQRLGAQVAKVLRYEPDGMATVVGGWSVPGMDVSIGTLLTVEGRGVAVSVLHTGQPARVERPEGPPGSVAACLRSLGVICTAGSPIVVEGRRWGVVIVGSTEPDALPAGSEDRTLQFTELVATAIANAQARTELRTIADEQAALRRVATLVAHAAPPAAVFAAVCEEIGRLLPADLTLMVRYDRNDTPTVVAGWSATGESVPVGFRSPLVAGRVSMLVRDTGRPVRIDHYPDDAGAATKLGIRSAVGAPITVQGRLWGLMVVASTGTEPPPPGTETRLGDFTELVATAIANAQAHAELTASRARIVASADETRRRIERDLHDGAQQRLVSLALQLRAAQAAVPPGLDELAAELDRVADGLNEALVELRELASGIHPAILVEGGLGPALRTLARRSAVPVDLEVRVEGRLPQPVEVGAYYVVSEALTNAAKHAHATAVTVDVEVVDDVLRVRVSDDGVGGAHFARGSGLVGLKDRAEALGGRFVLRSEPGSGTSLSVDLPLAGDDRAGRTVA